MLPTKHRLSIAATWRVKAGVYNPVMQRHVRMSLPRRCSVCDMRALTPAGGLRNIMTLPTPTGLQLIDDTNPIQSLHLHQDQPSSKAYRNVARRRLPLASRT